MPFTYQGYTIQQPGTIVTSQSQGMAPAPTQNRLVVLLGVSTGGGQPKTLQTLAGKQDAISRLLGGALQTAAVRSYAGQQTTQNLAANVAYMRVNPAVQATLALTNGGTTVINLTSVEYGNVANQINAQVVAGSTQGLKATVAMNTSTYSKDNIYQAALSVQYTGTSASGTVTVANSTGTITGSAGAAGSETAQWTANFDTYNTLQQLVNFINAQPNWTATILSASGSSQTANFLDDAAAQQCKATAYTITANLSALVTWFNTVPIITAKRPAGVGLTPSVMTAPSYFTGGSDGTTANTDWSAALQALQNQPGVKLIVPITGDPSIHAMVSTHVASMSDPTVRKNRTAICGGVAGETVSQVVTRAQNLNSRRVSLVWPGIQDIDDITNTLTTYDPFYVAAQLAGVLSTFKVTQALTHQTLRARGLENNLANTLQVGDFNQLENNGVMYIQPYATNTSSGFRVGHSLTTWLQNQSLDNMELSMVCTEDYVTQTVGDAVDALVGSTGGPIGAGQVISEVDSTLRDLQKQGVIVGDQNTPAYSNIVSTLSGQQVTTNFNATIPAPMNYQGVTIAFSAYSSTSAPSAA